MCCYPGSKLVKITANRRIIPVRDHTSISTPQVLDSTRLLYPTFRLSPSHCHCSKSKDKITLRIPSKPGAKGDIETKAKIAALRSVSHPTNLFANIC